MPPEISAIALMRELLYRLALAYEFLRLTYPITHTERYFDFRPADVLLLELLKIACVLVGIPIVVVLWGFGAFSLGYLALAAIILFLLPPALVLGLMEIVLIVVRIRNRRLLAAERKLERLRGRRS